MAIDLSMFKSLDDEGQEVELSRPETKGWDDVVQVANHHKGSNDTVVRKFIDMYSLGLQWDWYTEYKDWLVLKESIETYNTSLVPDDEGNVPDPLPIPDMPVRPKQETTKAIMKREYAILREAAYGPYQEQMDKAYPDPSKSIEHVEQVRAQYPASQ